MIKLQTLLLGLFFVSNAMTGISEPRITFSDPGMHIFIVTNLGDVTVNVAGHYVTNNTSFNCIAGLLILEGSMTLLPGASIKVYWEDLEGTDGEIGYYFANIFSAGEVMLDYMEWGSTGHLRSSLAVEFGYWNTGDFITDDQPCTFVGSASDVGSSFWEAAMEKIRITNIDNEHGLIELTNLGYLDQAIGGWFFCNLNEIIQINDTYCISGDFYLAPNESSLFHWPEADGADGELRLCNSSDVDIGASLEDYVEWGFTGHSGSLLAVSEGLWITGDFIDYQGPFTFKGGGNDVGSDFWSYFKEGCTYLVSPNYDSEATIDDGSCEISPENSCTGDLNGDQLVNTTDLLNFLSVYGSNCI
jgi:hypothetical protein